MAPSTMPAGRSNPANIISDAAHEGNQHFYFLPPMVPMPTFNGMSDADAQPVVTICEWETTGSAGRCGRVLAAFSRTDGTGSEVIRYEAASQAFIVNWHTDRCPQGKCTLSTDRQYRIRVQIGVAEIGHADVVLGASASQLKNVATDAFVALVNGRTLPIRFRIEAGAVAMVPDGGSATVGTSGGEVSNSDGSVGLSFPAGALASKTEITVAPDEGTYPGTGDWADPVKLGPDGSAFAEPVRLTMRYDASRLPEGVDPNALGLSTWAGDHWEPVEGSTVNVADGTVSGDIHHFSTYAIQIWPNYVQVNPTGQPGITRGQQVTWSAYVWYQVPTTYTWCGYEWVRVRTGWFSYRWSQRWVCRTYQTTSTYPAAGIRINWASEDSTVIAVATPGYSVTGTDGTTRSPLITGRNAGSTFLRYWYFGGPTNRISMSVLPSLSIRTINNVPDSTAVYADLALRDAAVGQQFQFDVAIPTALATGTTVTVTHTNAAVTTALSTLWISAGRTSSSLNNVDVLASGRDTIIVSAPSYGPDTLIVEGGPVSFVWKGMRPSLAWGDSALVTMYATNPSGTSYDRMIQTHTLRVAVSPATLSVREPAGATFSYCQPGECGVRLNAGGYPLMRFVVKAVGYGIGSVTGSVNTSPAVTTTVSIPLPTLVGPQAACGHKITGIAFDGTAYWVGEGHDGLLQCLSRFDATTGALTQLHRVYLDHRGLHWVSSLGKLTSRTWGGPMYAIDRASAALTQIASSPTTGQPGREQSAPAVDADGQSYWILNAGIAERRRLFDHALIVSFPVTTTADFPSIAASDRFVFLLDGAGVNAYAKATGTFAGRQPLPHPHPCQSLGFGVSANADRIMYQRDCTHVEVVPVTVPLVESINQASLVAAMGDPRYGAAVATVNGKVYAFGGFSNITGITRKAEVYDPVTNRWSDLLDAPTARMHAATAVVGETIYIMGGTPGGGCCNTVPTIEAFNTSSGLWSTLSPMPRPREQFATAVIGGEIYVIGGWTPDCCAPFLASVQAFNPLSGQWTTKMDLPAPRAGHAAVVVNDRIFVVGGENNTTPGFFQAPALEYSPTANAWFTRSNIPVPRTLLGAAAVGDVIYTVGGWTRGNNGGVGNIEAFHTRTNTWSTRAPLNIPRFDLGVVSVGGVIFAVGGVNQVTAVGPAEVYRP